MALLKSPHQRCGHPSMGGHCKNVYQGTARNKMDILIRSCEPCWSVRRCISSLALVLVSVMFPHEFSLIGP
jgi:hypothetical protein